LECVITEECVGTTNIGFINGKPITKEMLEEFTATFERDWAPYEIHTYKIFEGKTHLDLLKIYLDICCYNRPFDNQFQMKVRLETEAKLYIQSGIRNKKYLLTWSYMLNYENEINPYDERKKSIAPWKEIAINYCSSSDDVLSLGQKIMERGIKAKDALHIACAIESGCLYFITTDGKLINKTIPHIKIINPIDFIRQTEDLL